MSTDINAKYPWVPFYEAVADKLLEYKSREGRRELNKIMAGVSRQFPIKQNGKENSLGQKLFVIELRDEPNNPLWLIDDISPYTVFFFMCYSCSEKNRIRLMKEIGDFLNIPNTITRPTRFDAIPFIVAAADGESLRMNYRDSNWHYQEDEHLFKDKIWKHFELSLQYAKGMLKDKSELIKLHSDITANKLGNRLTTGMYCICPNKYLMTSAKVIKYINNLFGLSLSTNMSASNYFSSLDAINNLLKASPNGVNFIMDIVLNSEVRHGT